MTSSATSAALGGSLCVGVEAESNPTLAPRDSGVHRGRLHMHKEAQEGVGGPTCPPSGAESVSRRPVLTHEKVLFSSCCLLTTYVVNTLSDTREGKQCHLSNIPIPWIFLALIYLQVSAFFLQCTQSEDVEIPVGTRSGARASAVCCTTCNCLRASLTPASHLPRTCLCTPTSGGSLPRAPEPQHLSLFAQHTDDLPNFGPQSFSFPK